MERPIIGIPIGDPAGIGPEIALKSLNQETLYVQCRPVLIGDTNVLEDVLKHSNLPLELNVIEDAQNGQFKQGTVDVIAVNAIDMNVFEYGVVSAQCGKASYAYLKKAVELALDFQIDAIATTPLNKAALKAGNVPFIGHTEMLASLSNTSDPLTMFEIENLRVFFLSRHVPLRDAIDMIREERIKDYIKRSVDALKRLGVEGTLAVAGLNPHSGEEGLFGSEEINEIIPAINAMQKEGYDVVGPIGADSIFALGLDGRFAAILSLYHDQGHIATKTYDFHRTVSITNGLPFLRTSVDHGTAFDIAGQNKANPLNMTEAIRLAAKYAHHFKKS